jgi:hypothetical protein
MHEKKEKVGAIAEAKVPQSVQAELEPSRYCHAMFTIQVPPTAARGSDK